MLFKTYAIHFLLVTIYTITFKFGGSKLLTLKTYFSILGSFKQFWIENIVDLFKETLNECVL